MEQCHADAQMKPAYVYSGLPSKCKKLSSNTTQGVTKYLIGYTVPRLVVNRMRKTSMW